MSKTLLILKHEFLNVLKRKGFVIMTLLFPMIALIAIGINQVVAGMDTSDPTEIVTIGYVDEVGIFNSYTRWNQVELTPYATPENATEALLEEEIDEYIIIPSDYVATGAIARPSAEFVIQTHDLGDTAPRRVKAAVDTGILAVSVLYTWTEHAVRR